MGLLIMWRTKIFLRHIVNALNFSKLVVYLTSIRNSERFLTILALAIMLATIPNIEPVYAQEIAFPGAEGFGRFSQGGRGGSIIQVTNLNDSGPGSLRSCIDQKFPRICMFEVSGIIELKSTITVDTDESFLTVAGQSAPHPGITIRNDPNNTHTPIRISGEHVIFRYLRVRPGPSQDTTSILDGIEINGGSNTIFDHVSVSWSTDETFSSWFSPQNVTLQNSIISEGLFCSTHENGCHSKGVLVSGDESGNFSIVKNLMAHHRQRLPMVKTASGSNQIVNNVSYNPEWGATFSQDDFGPIKIDYVNNYFKQGPNTTPGGGFIKIDDSKGNNFKVYALGNTLYDKFGNEVYSDVYRSDVMQYLISSPHNLDGLNILEQDDVYDNVLGNAGANMQLTLDGQPSEARDIVDQRVVHEVRNGNGKITDGVGNRCWQSVKATNHLKNGIGYPTRNSPHCLSAVDYQNAGLSVSSSDFDSAGWPKFANNERPAGYDSDNDGLYDEWEQRFFGSLVASTHGDPDGDGYTNIEELLNITDPGNASQVAPLPVSSVTPSPIPPTATPIITSTPSDTVPDVDSIYQDAEVLYQFDEGSGDIVYDTSGNEPAINLAIEDPTKVQWEDGLLSITQPTILSSVMQADRLSQTCRQSGQLSFELWIKPSIAAQGGPARILTLSGSPSASNFTVGHGLSGTNIAELYDVRVRTTETDAIGRPSLMSPESSATTELTHIVYTRGADGEAEIYIDGELIADQQSTGTFTTWDDGYNLALANEFEGGRPWIGEYHLVALYCKKLAATDIKMRFDIGSTGPSLPVSTPQAPTNTPTPEATPTIVSTVTPTPQATPTAMSTVTPTPTPTNTPAPDTISGELYIDSNGNGVKDPTEEPLAGVIALLIDIGTEGQTLTLTTMSDANGFYIFRNISVGDYIISFALPPGYRTASGADQISISNTDGTAVIPPISVVDENNKMFLPLVEHSIP